MCQWAGQSKHRHCHQGDVSKLLRCRSVSGSFPMFYVHLNQDLITSDSHPSLTGSWNSMGRQERISLLCSLHSEIKTLQFLERDSLISGFSLFTFFLLILISELSGAVTSVSGETGCGKTREPVPYLPSFWTGLHPI